ncbi:ABC transporter substrate-binding protein [Novosphingobium album (ex Liu et al. 2023)]|uniref:ABC transporter substrate-binding protein n=1 Tax=Novosphingobium album (ex Liu et al. 2023) TaxID=3031130 RepID=A0ABT5WMX7_9SPHN|nr:ABC transporter substrate-binding protein [Novosphingobium album (ex Liu et al. 2023)]MDE8651400.1 ABC transporter substrate-binding protein [Novosphingobium album (ex Liu et al. 2023)]
MPLLPALALAACAQAPAGEERAAHPTIISLNPCSDAVLAEVAAPGQLLAISHYSHDPAASSMDLARARRFRAVSGSVEEIAALAPDVVIAGTFLPPATGTALRDLGITVVTVPIATDVAQSEAQVRDLARLTGNPGKGEALVGDIEASLKAAAPPRGARAIPAIVWQSGGIVAGEGALIVDLLRRTGFANGAAARGLGQADYLPLERMVADPPRVIFAAGDPRSEDDRMLGHPALVGLPGVRRERFASSLLWCGGPTIMRAARRLAQVRRAFEQADGAGS